MSLNKKLESNLFNNSSEDFVPLACHYDENTLLTKNGELLQTIEINGIHAEEISKELFNLRAVVRKSIEESIDCTKFAFWVHTIRRKADLDDPAEYPGFLSESIHNIWKNKNYWHDKFVNRLYITVIHDSPKLKLKNFNSIVNSLSHKTITKFEEKFFESAVKELDETVNSILKGLKAFGAEKLGMWFEGEQCFSDPIFLYRRIMQLNEEECPVPISDVSKVLSSHNYTVGNDKIEVVGDEGKKFASIMSIKEYREVSAEQIDQFLQSPVEMIATEVFYFVDRREVEPIFKNQDYILKVSGDDELKNMKGLNKIFDEKDNGVRFCHQQISFMVMGEDLKTLDQKVKQASDALSNIGIVHVREDIDLEKAFWAQLPANFSFLSRMKPAILDNVAALASLHNFPTGHQYSPWGRAITLLRTEKGTPYFMNFHDESKQATTCIFGERNTGKTVLLNFLLSESEKYHPTTVYITDDMDSGLYIKARAGKWFQRQKNIVNPLICRDSPQNRQYVYEFLKIITKHYFDPLGDTELGLLKLLSDKIFAIPRKERSLAKILSTISERDKGGKILQERVQDYIEGGVHYGIFESDKAFDLLEGGIVALNLQDFDDAVYTKEHYPKEKKLIYQFEYDLNSRRAVKAGIIYALQNILVNSNGRKILAIDNLEKVMNVEHYQPLFKMIAQNMNENDDVFISTIDSEELVNLDKRKVALDWHDQVNTKFVLPSEITVKGKDRVIGLDRFELRRLSEMTIQSRQFLIKQDDVSIASEFSIGGFPGIVKLLASHEDERKIYANIIKNIGGDNLEEWVRALYSEFESMS